MRTNRLISGLLALLLAAGSSAYAEDPPNLTSTNTNNSSQRSVTAGCVPGATSTELALNNIRALIHTGGDMWWDLQGTAKYEIPKGSLKTSLFAGSIWIGGVDVNGQLKLSAVMFRSNGTDYWPGPLITSGEGQASVSYDVCMEYDRHFIITRDEVAEFNAWYNSDPETQEEEYPGYSVPDIIRDWPAHADHASGYPYHLAPFYDVNDDDSYNPGDGDYPYYDLMGDIPCNTELRIERLYGDQTLWWVYNDKGNIHTETGGDAIGMEIHAQAFAFSTNDELNNMTFYNYRIINRSTYTLQDTYFGVWTDADLGYAWDDYVGCDVNRGLGYLYNGEAVDGNGQINAYGGPTPPPPAVGVDFFEGPYQDPDGLDNLSMWERDETGSYVSNKPECDRYFHYVPETEIWEEVTNPTEENILTNGNINGLNFGDGVVDNERWGMRRYIYFNNDFTMMGNPEEATHYYNYLRGIWKDGTKMMYGGTGHISDAATTNDTSDFMFPYDSDPCGWGTGGIPHNDYWYEPGENNAPHDRRFIQSAGPFTLEPGAVNDVTVGIPWARAMAGGPFSSVEDMKRADDKAQLLFENCFRVVDGPDAPELTILEMDKQLIFHIWNRKNSNNYMEEPEDYIERDPFIICPDDDPGCDKFYRFQGYQVFQLKNNGVSVSDRYDPSLAREVYQCDIKDGVGQLVNYYWNEELGGNEPVEEVNGADQGIEHTFTITEDLFATGDDRLVNNKKYYYMVIAYGYNNYLTYDQNDPNSIEGQKTPYKAGRKGVAGSIKTYEVIPHINTPENGGTVINAEFGDGPRVTQIEGHGTADNYVELTQETIDDIMDGEPWKATTVTYDYGASPVQVKVIDPANLPPDTYHIKFDSVDYNDAKGHIKESKWYIYNTHGDTVYSDKWISKKIDNEYVNINNEQIIPEWGISVTISQVDYPGRERDDGGYLGSSMTYSDPTKQWLYFLPDAEGDDPQNWIRAGTFKDPDNPDIGDNISGGFVDPDQIYEKVVNGTWAPYILCSSHRHGFAYNEGQALIDLKKQRLSSFDLVITADKSKWTRSPVVELCENDSANIDSDPDLEAVPGLSGIMKFDLRNSPSVDKDGRNQYDPDCNIDEATMNSTQVFTQEDYDNGIIDDQDLIGISYTMGWFPGYAIDVETGERLNIMFGEDSWYAAENGKDMMWNPTPNLYTDLYYSTAGAEGNVLFGGKHAIYIMGHNNWKTTGSNIDTLPLYDYGDFIYHGMKNLDPDDALDKTKQNIYRNAMWVGVPFTNPDHELLACDITIKIRTSNPYYIGKNGVMESPDPQNDNKPMYSFSTADISTVTNNLTTAKSALDLIRVVPNPYYGYSEYESSQIDNVVKITNLPQLCNISIYSINGVLIRKYKKDSPITYQEWDMKNQYGIAIAGGVYIIHVEAPGVGEKIVKWFGAQRPIDLNSF